MPFKFNHQGYKKAVEDNFTIINKDKTEVDFLLNKPQLHFTQNAQERNVILKARKMGFSSVLLAIACVKFLYGRNERCVSMSFDKEASKKQLERAKHFLRSYDRKNGTNIVGKGGALKYNSTSEMVLEVPADKDPEGKGYTNTLRIGTAKSTGFGRGDDITFLHLTEVSLADNLEQLLAGVGEAVVNDAMVTLETTANGFNEFKTFWDEASSNARDYGTFFYDPSWEYDQEFLDRKKRHLGRLFDQEYPMTPELAFIASGQHYFDTQSMKDYLEEVKTTEPQKTPKRWWRKYREWQEGEFVVAFADTAAGGGDFCACQFLSKTKLDIPLVYHKKTIATDMTPELHTELERIADITGVAPVVAFERNNGGVFELERLAQLNRHHKYKIYRMKQNVGASTLVSDSPKLGWDTNTATRPAMLGMIKEAIDSKLIKLYDRPTVNEMFSFVEVQTTMSWRAQAEKGAHDDLIMSLAGVWQLYQSEQPKANRRPIFRKKREYDPVSGRLLS